MKRDVLWYVRIYTISQHQARLVAESLHPYPDRAAATACARRLCNLYGAPDEVFFEVRRSRRGEVLL